MAKTFQTNLNLRRIDMESKIKCKNISLSFKADQHV